VPVLPASPRHTSVSATCSQHAGDFPRVFSPPRKKWHIFCSVVTVIIGLSSFRRWTLLNVPRWLGKDTVYGTAVRSHLLLRASHPYVGALACCGHPPSPWSSKYAVTTRMRPKRGGLPISIMSSSSRVVCSSSARAMASPSTCRMTRSSRSIAMTRTRLHTWRRHKGSGDEERQEFVRALVDVSVLGMSGREG